jgi:hypothetical protein
MFRCGEVYDLVLPDKIRRYLNDIGGLNLYGDPIFRVVWSNNATKETTLPWPALGNSVLEKAKRLRYGRAMVHDRFVLEKWQPPELYGEPEDWVESEWKPGSGIIDYGPYPSRGKYNFTDTIEGLDDNGNPCFLMPTRDYLRTAVEAANHVRSMSAWEYRRIIEAEEAEEQRAADERRLAMIQDANKPSNYHDVWLSLNSPQKAS